MASLAKVCDACYTCVEQFHLQLSLCTALSCDDVRLTRCWLVHARKTVWYKSRAEKNMRDDPNIKAAAGGVVLRLE